MGVGQTASAVVVFFSVGAAAAETDLPVTLVRPEYSDQNNDELKGIKRLGRA